MSATDQQRLFAAKYVELGCSVAKASEAVGISEQEGMSIRMTVGCSQEIDKLLTLGAKSALVSRSYVRFRLLEIIEIAMTPVPKLYKGVPTEIAEIDAKAAIAAFRELKDQGFVEDIQDTNSDSEQLTDSERVARLRKLLESQRTPGIGQASKKKSRKSKVC